MISNMVMAGGEGCGGSLTASSSAEISKSSGQGRGDNSVRLLDVKYLLIRQGRNVGPPRQTRDPRKWFNGSLLVRLLAVSRAGRLTATRLEFGRRPTGLEAAAHDWIGRPERLSKVHR